ncbi:unnamed protein product, partial [Pylaiella littoralis]
PHTPTTVLAFASLSTADSSAAATPRGDAYRAGRRQLWRDCVAAAAAAAAASEVEVWCGGRAACVVRKAREGVSVCPGERTRGKRGEMVDRGDDSQAMGDPQREQNHERYQHQQEEHKNSQHPHPRQRQQQQQQQRPRLHDVYNSPSGATTATATPTSAVGIGSLANICTAAFDVVRSNTNVTTHGTSSSTSGSGSGGGSRGRGSSTSSLSLALPSPSLAIDTAELRAVGKRIVNLPDSSAGSAGGVGGSFAAAYPNIAGTSSATRPPNRDEPAAAAESLAARQIRLRPTVGGTGDGIPAGSGGSSGSGYTGSLAAGPVWPAPFEGRLRRWEERLPHEMSAPPQVAAAAA